MARLQLKRGLKANLPTTGMLPGEPMVTTDQGTLHVATDATTSLPVVPAVDMLASLSAVDGAADLILVYDASESAGQRAKRMTINEFRNGLNIPPASTDEKVAVVEGGAAGYLWGTDGTDGVLRMNTSMQWTKDPANGFVTLAVGSIDCGTF